MTEETTGLRVMQVEHLKFVVSVNVAGANIGLVSADPEHPDEASVFDKTLVLLDIEVESLPVGAQDMSDERTKEQHQLLMEADHAIDRGLALINAGRKALQHPPIAVEDMKTLLATKSGE